MLPELVILRLGDGELGTVDAGAAGRDVLVFVDGCDRTVGVDGRLGAVLLGARLGAELV
ncbi:MAG: hypothetical protein JW720_13325 [Sedimentisphaerales bacterium]|nr:hypothetical protein [Sedimentisphaerales bacterium]